MDKMWDEKVGVMCEVYGKTYVLVEAGQLDEAGKEFKAFSKTLTEFYPNIARTYPPRFAKIKDWCAWSRELVQAGVEADKVLKEKKPREDCLSKLDSIRAHFTRMHTETRTRGVNDEIFDFWTAAKAEKPDAAKLQTLREAIEGAAPSAKAKASPDEFQKAKTAWHAAVDPILADGAVSAEEKPALGAAAGAFYKAYGIQFE